MDIETRVHPRIPVDWHAHIETSVGSIEVKTINISVGGACILYPTGYEFEQRSLIFLKPPGAKAIRAIAEAVWSDRVNSENRMRYKIGVRFITISPEDQQLLETLVQKESGLS